MAQVVRRLHHLAVVLERQLGFEPVVVGRALGRFADGQARLGGGPIDAYAGESYLAVTTRAAKAGDPVAEQALEGISNVLRNREKRFTLVYEFTAPAVARREPSRLIKFIVTPTLSVAACQVKAIEVVDRAVPARLVGADGGVRSIVQVALAGLGSATPPELESTMKV